MGVEAIVERIISDAEEEARATVAAAEERAAQAYAEAERRAERHRTGTQAECAAKAAAIAEGRAATARLDSAKVLLAEKRRVIDSVYSAALLKLNSLKKTEALKLAERLLKDYAEEGDELVFAESYPYAKEVSSLAVTAEKSLKVSAERADISGGFILRGEKSDKDLSYGALLAADREERQAELAAEIFADESLS